MSEPIHIFISPHRDDVCFSLAVTVGVLGGGHLINIFSKSKYTSHPSLINLSPPLSTEIVTAIRDQEDREFAQAMNLERHELELEDADLRGLPWNIHEQREESPEGRQQVQKVIDHLAPLLGELTTGTTATIYCPMAIGGHRDHISTLLASVQLHRSDWGKLQRWIFYEDLPYASWPGVREESIQDFQRIAEDISCKQYSLPLSPQQMIEKLNLVRIYASQHPHAPSIDEFMGVDPWATGPHESLWICARSLIEN